MNASTSTRYVRITSAPAGEAPLWVREQWVGLLLPLVYPQGSALVPKERGVLTGPKSFLGALGALAMGKFERVEGYTVDARTAIDILARNSPEAAEWWRQNTPYLLQPGQHLLFEQAAGCICEG